MACVVVLAVAVTTVCALLLSARFAAIRAEVDLQERLAMELESLSLAVDSAVVANRVEAIEPILRSYVQRLDIEQAGYRGSFGSLTAKDESALPANVPDWFVRWLGLQDKTGSRAVSGRDDDAGTVFLELCATSAIERAWERVVQSVLLAGLGLGIALAGFGLIFREGMQSLRTMIDAGAKLGEGKLTYRIPPVGSPEFRAAKTAFNTIADNIERLVGDVRLREANLSITLRSIGDAVLVTDAEGRVSLMNPVAEWLTGWPESEARGHPVGQVFCIVNHYTRQPVENPVEIVLREGKVVGLANHTVLIARDGVERPIADSGAPIRAHPDSPIEGVVLVFRDQSEEYRMTEALRESEELHSSLIKSAPLGIFRLDDKGDVVYCSEVMSSFVDIPLGDLDRTNWQRAIHPEDFARFIEGWRHARREGVGFSITLRYGRPERGLIWVDLRLAPLRDAEGRISGFVGTALNVTAEREAQRRIEDLSSLYATLSAVNSAIVRCRSEAELFREICRAAVERGGFSGAWIGLADWESGRVEMAAFHGSLEETVRQAVVLMQLNIPSGRSPGLVVSAFLSGRSQVSNDIQNDPRVASHWQEDCCRVGIRAYAAMPVTRFGEVVAVLALMSPQCGFFSADVVALADEIGRDVSFALENFDRERERQATTERLAQSEERLRMTLDSVGIGLKEVNLRTHRVRLDATAARIIGLGNQAVEVDMDRYLGITFPSITKDEIHQLGEDIDMGRRRNYTFERSFTRPDGSLCWLRTHGGSLTRMAGSGDDPISLSIMVDVTEQHQQAERERLAMAMFTNSYEAIAITDAKGDIIMVNKAFRDQTGYEPEEVLGANPRILKSGRHDETFYRNLWDALQADDHWQGEIWNRRKDGDIFPALVNISAVRDSAGKITHYVDQSTDISLQKQFEERITYLAYRDSLTDLPNRVLLRDRVEQALATAQREATPLALLFLDLDHFKNINDSLGHVVGDRLLREVAQRLSRAVREMDTVGRLGGDEFLVMLPVTDAEAAAHVAQKLLDQISQPFAVEAHDLMVTPSIGIAMFPRDGASFDELLKTADTAMYRSKDEGRNTYRFFTPEMNEAVSQRLVLENSLRRAIEAKEFVLFFQPQYDIGARSLIGAEALIRWREPTLGFVSPGQFIPIAEESNLIEAIGAWVLDEACRQIRSWIDQGYPMLRVSVNFSARQFAARGVVENFDRVLARHGLSGAALEVEITESLLAGDMEYTLGVLTALRARGVHVAVDDFGTGYSSLSYLKRFPINRLKIDQSFVRDIESDADDRAIATAVVTLGHSLGMQVIAEGVEGETQLEILAAMGCDEVQGFHLGRPMSAEQFTALLEKAA